MEAKMISVKTQIKDALYPDLTNGGTFAMVESEFVVYMNFFISPIRVRNLVLEDSLDSSIGLDALMMRY